MFDRKIFNRGTAVAAACIIASVAGLAEAHPRLLSTSPAPNATVSATNRLVLNFSEPLVSALSGADLYMSHGRQTMKVNGLRPSTSSDHKSLVLFTGRPLAHGTYRLDWHAVSVDTHRVRGTVTFNVR